MTLGDEDLPRADRLSDNIFAVLFMQSVNAGSYHNLGPISPRIAGTRKRHKPS